MGCEGLSGDGSVGGRREFCRLYGTYCHAIPRDDHPTPLGNRRKQISSNLQNSHQFRNCSLLNPVDHLIDFRFFQYS